MAAFDIDAKRLKMAREFGADELLNSKAPDLDARIASITEGKGFDVMVDMAGGKREVLDMCFKRVRDGGTVLLFGLYGDETIAFDPKKILKRAYRAFTGSATGSAGLSAGE
ncbi:MAG: zinc-binding dehydrogenase [Candidatus Sumerlaeota bacterium]|nr:zinc-binding dehydrogenase [Candidatus Sumerlaeota bacterium]